MTDARTHLDTLDKLMADLGQALAARDWDAMARLNGQVKPCLAPVMIWIRSRCAPGLPSCSSSWMPRTTARFVPGQKRSRRSKGSIVTAVPPKRTRTSLQIAPNSVIKLTALHLQS